MPGQLARELYRGSKTASLPRKLIFQDEAKLFELVKPGGYVMNLEGRQAIEEAIRSGRGGVFGGSAGLQP